MTRSDPRAARSSASTAVQFLPAVGVTPTSCTFHGPTVRMSPGFAIASRSLLNAAFDAIPTSATAIPKCATTIPQVASGARKRFRRTSGTIAAAAR